MHKRKRIWFAYMCLSVVVNSLFGLFEPYSFYDSQKYLLAAAALANGSFRPEDLLVEVVIGYPALVAVTMSVARSLGLEFMNLLVPLQVMMCIGIDAAVLFIATTLTARPGIFLPAALFSVFSIETKLMAVTVMTEIPYLFFLTVAVALFLGALAKKSLPLAGGGALVALLSGLFRPLGWAFALLFWGVWWTKVVLEARRNSRGQSTLALQGRQLAGHKAVLGTRAILLPATATLIATSLAISAVSALGKNPEIGFRERLAVLWLPTIQANDEMYRYFTKTEAFRQYNEDYLAWVRSKKVPPRVHLEPAWTPKPLWEYDENPEGQGNKDLRWRKVPPWVLMSQRNFTMRESLAWQTKIALNLILSHPITYFKQIIRNTQFTLYKQSASDDKILSAAASEENNHISAMKLKILEAINEYHQFLSPNISLELLSAPKMLLTLPMLWWLLLLFIGMVKGFTVYEKWPYGVVVLAVSVHMIMHMMFSFSSRYRLPIEIFSGIFTMGWFYPLLQGLAQGFSRRVGVASGSAKAGK